LKPPILFVGTSTLDHLALVERIPESDQRIRALQMISCGGGPAANAAAAAKTLGAPCSLLSAVGDDKTGAEIVADLRALGIAVDGVQVVPGGQSSASLIHVERNGNRTITAFGGVIERYDLARLPEHLIEQCAIVHADGNNPRLTERVFQIAKRLGIMTSLDGGNIPEQALMRLLPLTNVFITDAKSVPASMESGTDVEICKAFAAHGPSCVVITNGKQGCTMWTGESAYDEPGLRVKVVDTTGAGDNFHGAFVYGLWDGLSLPECLRLANLFAAVSCEGLGGRGKLCTPDELKSYELVQGVFE